tara:strand:- start:3256 stop:3681 length:426 start_codon:yes stop_codon:yes gene_type:complete
MKKIIVTLLIAIVLIPQTSFAMTLEERVEVMNKIEILLKRILVLQDLLIELKQKELAEKKEQLAELKADDNQVETMAKEKTYKVTSPEDGKIEVNESMTVEEMREFVISLNRDHIKFRKQMESASEKELVEFLKSNGYTVK